MSNIILLETKLDTDQSVDYFAVINFFVFYVLMLRNYLYPLHLKNLGPEIYGNLNTGQIL